MKNWIAGILIMIVLVAGCQEEQKKVWGKGELDANWREMFGKGNGARLDFVQTQRINTHSQALQALPELLKRIQALEAENPAELARRVRELEDTDTYGQLAKHIEDALGEARFINAESDAELAERVMKLEAANPVEVATVQALTKRVRKLEDAAEPTTITVDSEMIGTTFRGCIVNHRDGDTCESGVK